MRASKTGIITWVFPWLGKTWWGLLQNRPACGSSRTPAHPFSPTINRVREAVNALSEEEDHAGTTNNDWPTDLRRRDEAPPSDTNRKPGDGTSLSRKYRISGPVEPHAAKFLNGRTEDSTSHSCICLREYIANRYFSDKYLIAEFLL